MNALHKSMKSCIKYLVLFPRGKCGHAQILCMAHHGSMTLVVVATSE